MFTFTAREIVEHISRGEWTASEVLEAYIARATLAHQTVNCLTEGASARLARRIRSFADNTFCAVLFEEARTEASALDKEFKLTGKLRGPLHGVPVSFKDPSENLERIFGHPSNIGRFS